MWVHLRCGVDEPADRNSVVYMPHVKKTSEGDSGMPSKQSLAESGMGMLEPNHSHYILVDSTRWGGELTFRAELESALATYIPQVLIMAAGGEKCMNACVIAARNKRPVIVVQGTGQMSDIVAHHWIQKEKNKAHAQKKNAES
eukprot:gene29108-36189_t